MLLSCVCVLATVAPLLVRGQLHQFPGQTFPGQTYPAQTSYPGQEAYPGQAAQPDYSQPLTATNYQVDGHQRTESVDGQGNLKGQYSYVDPNGKTITVKYTAGKDGYQVEGDHLPRAPAVPSQPQPQYQPQQYQGQPQYQAEPQYQQQYQSQPVQYQPQSQYQPQQYQSQYQPQQYQQQQYQPQPQEYQPQQFQPQQYTQQSQYQPQQYEPFAQPSFQLQGFPQNRFGSPSIPPGVSVSQNPNGGFTYSYSPISAKQ